MRFFVRTALRFLGYNATAAAGAVIVGIETGRISSQAGWTAFAVASLFMFFCALQLSVTDK